MKWGKIERFISNKPNIYIFASHKYNKNTKEVLEKIILKNNDIIVLSNSPTDDSIHRLLNINNKKRVN